MRPPVNRRARRRCFNEAGPQGAGKPEIPAAAAAGERGLASMRPARKGPENRVSLADWKRLTLELQ